MKILVACECSGIVREAFRAKGHDVTSCDIKPSEDDSPYHKTCDVKELLQEQWDMIIAFPPCTYFSNVCIYNHPKRISPERFLKQQQMLDFVKQIWNSADKVCIENPKGWLSSLWCKESMRFQPYEFGDDVMKLTCFWLKGLDPIYPFFTQPGKPLRKVPCSAFKRRDPQGYALAIQAEKASKDDRATYRSRFHPKTAARMAELWG